MTRIPRSDLITNNNGSIYHLRLKPGDIADTVILVGDPGRVRQVSSFFDRKDFEIENREFVTHTGYYKDIRISALSTGIGTDNIDIVLNELDALVNIDLYKREIKKEHRSLRLIRLGTSGLLDPELEPGTFVLSEISCGLDGIIHFYQDSKSIILKDASDLFVKHFDWNRDLPVPYFIRSSGILARFLGEESIRNGITISTPGFYGPQFRSLRAKPFSDQFFQHVNQFGYGGARILNFEMESSALYGLSKILGHEALTICVGIANRMTGEVITNYKPRIDQLIEFVLNRLTDHDENES